MTRDTGHMMNEADIGSGEKGAAEKETEQQMQQIPPQGKNKPFPAEDEGEKRSEAAPAENPPAPANKQTGESAAGKT